MEVLMKKLVSLFLFSFIALPLAALGSDNDLDVSIIRSHYSFKMPKLTDWFSGNKTAVKQKGDLSGFKISYTRHNIMKEYFDLEDDVFIKLEGEYLSGKVDQTNAFMGYPQDFAMPGSIKDVKVREYDFRFLAGQAYQFGGGLWELTPYMGLGYHQVTTRPTVWFMGLDTLYFVPSDWSKMKQFYVPLGMNFSFKPTDRVQLKVGGEFDGVIHGSYTMDAKALPPPPLTFGGRDYDKRHNPQATQHGWGFRLNARAEIGYKYVSVFVEPFYNYWKSVGDGEAVMYSKSTPEGNALWYLRNWIPNHVTKEYGLRAGVRF